MEDPFEIKRNSASNPSTPNDKKMGDYLFEPPKRNTVSSPQENIVNNVHNPIPSPMDQLDNSSPPTYDREKPINFDGLSFTVSEQDERKSKTVQNRKKKENNLISTNGPQNFRKFSKEAQNTRLKAALPRLREISTQMANCYDDLYNKSGQERQEAVLYMYSLFEEASSVLGKDENLKRTLVIGQQSAGKTSLFEALLCLPLGVPKQGIATKIVLLLRMRMNREAHVPKIKYHYKGATKTCNDPAELLEDIVQINDAITAFNKEDYIEITIEYNKCRTMTFIDLPGIFVSKTANGSFNPDDVKELVAYWVQRRAHDRILFVHRSIDEKANTIAIEFMETLDPNYERTTVVLTHLDSVKTDLEDNLNAMVKTLPSGKVIRPYVLTLHNIATTDNGKIHRKSPWGDIKAEIERAKIQNNEEDVLRCNNLTNEGYMVWKNYIGLAAFEKSFHHEVNTDTLSNINEIKNALTIELQRVSHLSKDSEVELAAMGDPKHQIQSFLNAFVIEMGNNFKGTAFTNDIIQKHGETVDEEIQEAETFMQRLASPIAPWPEVFDHQDPKLPALPNQDCRLVTKLKLQRCKADIKRRMESVTTNDLTKDQILGAIQMTDDKIMIETAAGPLLRMIAEERLTVGVPYCVGRVIYIVENLRRLALDTLTKSHPQFKVLLSTQFATIFDSVFEEYLAEKTRISIERCKTFIHDIIACHMWSLTEELDQFNSNLPTRNDQNKKEKNDKTIYYDQLRTVLKPIIKDPSLLTEEVIRNIYGAATKKSASGVFERAMASFSTSSEVSAPQEHALREHIATQFNSLRALITLQVIFAIESNITKEFDTKVSKDQTLTDFLTTRIIPLVESKQINLDEARQNLQVKSQDFQSQRTQLLTLIDIAPKVVEAIKDEIVAFQW